MTNEQKIGRGIERALDGKRAALTSWELAFLTDLQRIYTRQKTLSLKQKSAAYKILARLEIPMEY